MTNGLHSQPLLPRLQGNWGPLAVTWRVGGLRKVVSRLISTLNGTLIGVMALITL